MINYQRIRQLEQSFENERCNSEFFLLKTSVICRRKVISFQNNHTMQGKDVFSLNQSFNILNNYTIEATFLKVNFQLSPNNLNNRTIRPTSFEKSCLIPDNSLQPRWKLNKRIYLVSDCPYSPIKKNKPNVSPCIKEMNTDDDFSGVFRIRR